MTTAGLNEVSVFPSYILVPSMNRLQYIPMSDQCWGMEKVALLKMGRYYSTTVLLLGHVSKIVSILLSKLVNY